MPCAPPRASGKATCRPRRRLPHDEGAGTTHTRTAPPPECALPGKATVAPAGVPIPPTASHSDAPRVAPASSRKALTSVRVACLAASTIRRNGPE